MNIHEYQAKQLLAQYGVNVPYEIPAKSLAEVRPAAEKIAAIELLKAEGRRILMVGDGLNDAPALAAAHASISPITAAHLTQAHADALFLGERLMPVLRAVVMARNARALMRQNLILTVIYNALAVPFAMAGMVTPLFAALAMSGSSMLVTLNAIRARFGGPGEAVDASGTSIAADARLPVGTPIGSVAGATAGGAS